MSSAGVCVFMALVTSNLELLAALRAGALRNSELAYCRLVVRIVHFVSDFASKMACTICDMAKVVAINNAAKAKTTTYCRSTRSLKHKNKTVLTSD